MAVSGKKPELDGWQHRADRPAREHTAIPALPKTAAALTPRHQLQQPLPRSVPPAGEARRPDRRAAVERRSDQAANAPAKDFSREEALDWILKARKEAVAIRTDKAKAAEARITELEASLEAALARVTCLGDENQALQTALDMAADENLSLGRRLAESETGRDEARAELQSAAMLRAEHDMVIAAAGQEIELLQNTITVRNARLQKLEQARRKMERDTSKLLETNAARDKALAAAEHRILVLTELFEKLELSLEGNKGENDNLRPGGGASKPEPSLTPRTDLAHDGGELRLWRRELDTDDWLLGRPARQSA